MVPIVGTWDEDLEEPHVLAGSVDRLSVRFYRRNETLNTSDFKTHDIRAGAARDGR